MHEKVIIVHFTAIHTCTSRAFRPSACSDGSKGALGGTTTLPIEKSSAPNSAPNKKRQWVFVSDMLKLFVL